MPRKWGSIIMKEVKQPDRKRIFYFYAIAIALLFIANMLLPSLIAPKTQSVTYDEFVDMAEAGQVAEAEIQSSDNKLVFIANVKQSDGTEQKQVFETALVDDPNLVERLIDADVKFTKITPSTPSPILTALLPMVIIIGLGVWMTRSMQKKMGAGAMSFGKSNAKVYVASETGIHFSDVQGEDEAKELLTEIVDFLHNPQRYADIGAHIPKGALLVGPPGTGKTLLAKAVAGEANVPFFSISGSEFVEMFVGMGAAKVRDLFKQANEKAPCIVFIDEIDTIGKKRDGAGGISGGNDEREQTLNQLLTEMDGFDGSKGVVILAATNRPESLDPALLRPGRFDRRVPVELPDLIGREAILRVHAKKVKCEPGLDFNAIARMAAGASGAELANMVNEAALRAVRAGRDKISQSDLEESVEVVIAGYQKKNKILSNKEKLIVSYHEIGHALVAALQTHSAPVTKITIIPRTSGALGYTMQVDQEEHNLMSREELENKIATLTGGRVAEELALHSITTGASNDIEQATRLARSLISRFGMSEAFGMVAFEQVRNAYLGGDASMACADQTAAEIDRMVVELVRRQYEKARQLLSDNMDKLHALSKYLYDHETITGEEFMKLMEQPKLEMGISEKKE